MGLTRGSPLLKNKTGLGHGPNPARGKKLNAMEDLHQIQGACTLDFTRNATVLLCRNTGSAARIYLPRIRREVPEELGIQVIHFFRRDVKATARHAPVGAAEVDGSLFGFRAHSSFVKC